MTEVITDCACGQLPPLEPEPQWTQRHAAAWASVLPAGSHVFSEEQDDIYPSLVRSHCSCGWAQAGYVRGWLALRNWEQHSADATGAAPQ